MRSCWPPCAVLCSGMSRDTAAGVTSMSLTLAPAISISRSMNHVARITVSTAWGRMFMSKLPATTSRSHKGSQVGEVEGLFEPAARQAPQRRFGDRFGCSAQVRSGTGAAAGGGICGGAFLSIGADWRDAIASRGAKKKSSSLEVQMLRRSPFPHVTAHTRVFHDIEFRQLICCVEPCGGL